jgi:cobalt-zinc-cadmium efflux system outer membrane protein
MNQKHQNCLYQGKQQKKLRAAVSRWLLSSVGSLVFVASFSVQATSVLSTPLAEPLTYDEAVAIALGDNPSLAQIRSRYEAQSEVPSQVGTLPDPTISVNAMNFPTNSFDQGQEAMTQVQIGFSQMFPFPGKLSLKKEAAEFEAVAAGHSVEEAKLHAPQRYYQVVAGGVYGSCDKNYT